MRPIGNVAGVAALVLSMACAADEQKLAQRAPSYKKWRSDAKMVVFGDSNSDAGRRFNAPGSFDFEGIGPYPWTKLYKTADDESKFRAYLPAAGAPTNGNVWPTVLRVRQEYNFATSSGSATNAFRSRETCFGYTGEGEKYPTATLEEQITRYFHDVVDHTRQTLDYTHVILFGANDMGGAMDAIVRYNIGGEGYADPVAFEDVFEIVNGTAQATYEPMIREVLTALEDGVTRLIDSGVTGRILVANLLSLKGFASVIASGQLDTWEQVSLAASTAVQSMVDGIPQLRMLDMYSFSAAIIDQPEVFEDLGFRADPGLLLGSPCLERNFVIDSAAEIMGTQDLRSADCQEECALCADLSSPCETCYQGNPSATICDNPDTRLFWDSVHLSSAAHEILAEAIRQCSKDDPNYDTAWVQLLCPDE